MAAAGRVEPGLMVFNEYGRLTRVLVCPAQRVFTPLALDEWQALAFTERPDQGRAVAQSAAFIEALSRGGARIDELPGAEGLTLDAIYTRDASVVSPRGLILCSMGKPARTGEPPVHAQAYGALGVEIAGAIKPPGRLEGGDVVWFDERTVAIGRGYRTNDEGIAQFRRLVGAEVDVVTVPLPHYRGPSDVFHLMSIVSPVHETLAVVYSPLMPVPFREWLAARGIAFVEVPDEEFHTMGANVLATAPRRCVMLDGNPVTRARLEAAGAEVTVYGGTEISVKGGGGPTCLTRPLVRL